MNNFICRCGHKDINHKLATHIENCIPQFIEGSEGNGICWVGWAYNKDGSPLQNGCLCKYFRRDNLKYLEAQYEKRSDQSKEAI